MRWTRQNVKRLGIELGVGCAIAYFGWVSIAKSQHAACEIADARLAIDEQRIDEYRLLESERPEPAPERFARLVTIAERINNKCSEAADAGGFYDRLTKVAEQSGLSIAGVQPKRGGAVGDASSLVTRSAYSMQVSGSYEDITKFLHRLNADFPLTAVIGVRIVPTPIAEKPDAVNATIDLATFTLAEMINVEADALDGELIGGVS